MIGLTREHASTIGFVAACYFANSIDTPELNMWAEHIMASYPSYPNYVVDLYEFKASRSHFYRAVGFTPSRELTQAEVHALTGITYLRGREVVDGPEEPEALSALSHNPHILDEFSTTFPFLKLQQHG
jgi:hypothetical protein